jgi:hypothetical protein
VVLSKEDQILEAFDEITKTKQQELSHIYEVIDDILRDVAHEIFIHIKRKKKSRYEEQETGFLPAQKIKKFEYEVFWIDSESLYKSLFYDDQKIDKKFNKVQKQLKQTEVIISQSFKEVYALLEEAVHIWQEPYELITKQREIASDLEFSNTRSFASKVYETVLIDYHNTIEGNIAAFKKKFAYLNGAVTLSYKQLIHASILHFEMSFNKQVASYENDPKHISLHMPHEEDVYNRLREEFSLDKVETYLNSRRNYLYKIVSYAKGEFIQTNKDKIFFLETKKDLYKDKIDALKIVKSDIII